MPVMFPPGWERLATRPASTGSSPAPVITMGIVLVAFLAARTTAVPACYHDDINLEAHQLRRELRKPIELPRRISVLAGDVLSFYVATLVQSQPNCL